MWGGSELGEGKGKQATATSFKELRNDPFFLSHSKNYGMTPFFSLCLSLALVVLVSRLTHTDRLSSRVTRERQGQALFFLSAASSQL